MHYNDVTITQVDPIEHNNTDFDVVNSYRYL